MNWRIVQDLGFVNMDSCIRSVRSCGTEKVETVRSRARWKIHNTALKDGLRNWLGKLLDGRGRCPMFVTV
jgi:hypothetical protein